MQSVSPVEKSPRPKIISTEVHDLSKDKKESEIWFKATEKEYTEVCLFKENYLTIQNWSVRFISYY